MTPRTQLSRSDRTKTRILDATIDALVELGYSRTTTQEVTRRSDMSRGAQLHHFPTRESLVVAAVCRLVDRRLSELLASAPAEPGFDVLVDAFSGPLFEASLELWVAARTDPELKKAIVPLEQKIADALRAGCMELFGDRLSLAEMELSVEAARGMALSRIFRDPTAEKQLRKRLLPVWERIIRQDKNNCDE